MLAYSVSLRRQEFGIRIALGSDKSRLTALVLRQAAWPVLGGAGVGLLLAFVATRWVRSMLYQTHTADPVAIAGSLLLLSAAVAAGCAYAGAARCENRPGARNPRRVARSAQLGVYDYCWRMLERVSSCWSPILFGSFLTLE